MKVLLDTNIIIHREGHRASLSDIGKLFYWFDKLKYDKYIHPLTIEELNRFKDTNAQQAMSIKIESYNILKHQAPLNDKIKSVSSQIDLKENDVNDTQILNEVYEGRVDLLISEDKKIHIKAELLGISDKIFRVDSFIEKVTAENPSLADYKVLAVKKQDFAEVDLQNSFFDSFREDYDGFDKWFNKKADETAYVCYNKDELSAFLYIKVENEDENYSDITPNFSRKKRLKIGTLKVISNGYKIGERFLKIIFDNALQYRVDEIYVTIFDKRPEQLRLISLLEDWGFVYFGDKNTPTGIEKVFVKNFDRSQQINIENPKITFPFSSKESKVFIVPIYPEYHTELFPDSILKTESPKNFVENEPHRNALSKVYISRSYFRNLKSGDLIVFYRTGDQGNAINTGVVTTIGIVDSMIDNISDEETFIRLCRKRSVFSDNELREHWNYNKQNRPFIVNFLYTYSFKKRPNLRWLNENGIVPDIMDMPRGFREISREDLSKILDYSIGK